MMRLDFYLTTVGVNRGEGLLWTCTKRSRQEGNDPHVTQRKRINLKQLSAKSTHVSESGSDDFV